MTVEKRPIFCLKNGRPPKHTPESLEEAVEGYFKSLERNRRGRYIQMPSKVGLAIHLGVTKQTLSRYSHKEGFSDPIYNAYLRIENAWIQNLWGRSCRGSIFYLTRAFGYRSYWPPESNNS